MSEYLCNNNLNISEIEYCTNKGINLKLPTNIINLDTILSIDCEAIIINIELKNYSYILKVHLYIKILYTPLNSTKLNIKQYVIPWTLIINVPEKLDGFPLKNLNFKNKISTYVKITNIEILNIANDFISIYLFTSSILKIFLSPSIIYFIKDESCNLYVSNTLSGQFKELNIESNTLVKIIFSKYRDSILFQKKYSLYEYSLITNAETFILERNGLIWWVQVDKNYFLLAIKLNTELYIILKNLHFDKEEIIYKAINLTAASNFLFANNILLFAIKDGMTSRVIIQHIHGNILFNNELQFKNIYQSILGTLFIIQKEHSFEIINLENMSTKKIDFPNNFSEILEVKFKDDDNIIILCRNNELYNISLLNLSSGLYEDLLSTQSTISSIDINNLNDIIYTSDSLGLFNVYYLKYNKKTSLYMKLFAKDIEVICRR